MVQTHHLIGKRRGKTRKRKINLEQGEDTETCNCILNLLGKNQLKLSHNKKEILGSCEIFILYSHICYFLIYLMI